MVIRYGYLWRAEHQSGREEASKDRPCAIVLVVGESRLGQMVTVLPITHSQPRDRQTAFELPADTKRRLGLDGERSWVILDEANRFGWPGPDIRRVDQNDPASFVHGQLPFRTFIKIRDSFVRIASERRILPVDRTE
jgi:mRNA-degrading endonuclease toxin of MazEF toxin-antitoxin module